MTERSDDPGRSRYFELQRLARQQGRDTQELLTLYALEGLLARLATSSHRDQLVLKGGMLLAAFGQRRPTRDLDVHARQLAGDVNAVLGLVTQIAAIPIEDGLRFDADGATAQTIRDDEEYSGVRVALDATLHTARLKVKVDVNVGDPIWPAPTDVAVPRLLDEQPLVLRGYPLHMVLAEKLVTAVDRGTANSRWRDFADIYLLTRQPSGGRAGSRRGSPPRRRPPCRHARSPRGGPGRTARAGPSQVGRLAGQAGTDRPTPRRTGHRR